MSEKKHEFLQSSFDEMHRKLEERHSEPIQIAYFSLDKNDIVKVDELEKEYQNLMLFWWFCYWKISRFNIVLFIRGRKTNVSVIY